LVTGQTGFFGKWKVIIHNGGINEVRKQKQNIFFGMNIKTFIGLRQSLQSQTHFE